MTAVPPAGLDPEPVREPGWENALMYSDKQLRKAVADAVAAERDRIRQLAEQHHAEYGRCADRFCYDEGCRGSFADLLDAP